MKAIAFNGSPRKTWNTAQLLTRALEGAVAADAETELVHIYDLDFKGCTSCFACKLIGGPSYGRCAMTDELTPVIERATEADVLIFGSPIYFDNVTGTMRCLLERMFFSHWAYDRAHPGLWPRRAQGAFIYTMNAPDFDRYREVLRYTVERRVEAILGAVTTLAALDTYQFSDYSRYYAPNYDPVAKKQRRKEVWPQDLQRAFELGRGLVEAARGIA